MISGKKVAKILHDPTKHYPNKMEAKMLRRIMSETGLNEEDVRSDKTHRKTLAKASKLNQKPKRGEVTKWYQDRIKTACKITGLVPQHPKTIEVLDEILKKSYKPFIVCFFNVYNAKKAVEVYAKK